MTSNDLRLEDKRMKRQQEKLFEERSDEFFYCSVMSAILRKSFASLDSLVLSDQAESTYKILQS